MANVFDIQRLAGSIAAARDKASSRAAAMIGNARSGHVVPPVSFPGMGSEPTPLGYAWPPYDEAQTQEAPDEDPTVYNVLGVPMCWPLALKCAHDQPGRPEMSQWWTLPVEPIIAVSGSNVLVRRKVAKSSSDAKKQLRGTIKERWAVDDYTISIDGLLTIYDSTRFPKADVVRLQALLESRDALDVKCPLLSDVLGITRIVVDRWEFPFSKGPENQSYRITAYSDQDWKLFLSDSQST